MRTITCACGAVRLKADGPPLLSVICHCNSCRSSGRSFDARSELPPVVDAFGGCAVVLWRKDRVRCVAGADRMEFHRLKPDSPTRRVVASCCKAPLFMDFTKGFWVSIYRQRVADAPLPTARMMLRDSGQDVPPLPDDGMTHLPSHSGVLMLTLLRTWAAMFFRRPRLAGVPD